jgi:hypothetical protein
MKTSKRAASAARVVVLDEVDVDARRPERVSPIRLNEETPFVAVDVGLKQRRAGEPSWLCAHHRASNSSKNRS